jgi:lauroyl/myristoyl acyltransferase
MTTPVHSMLPVFRWAFIGPTYWPRWALISAIALCSVLPRVAMLGVGRLLGWLFFWRNKKRRHIADVNISLCFPDLSDGQRADMVRRHFLAYGQGIVDFGLVWWASRKRLDRWCSISGIEKCQAVLESGAKVLLVTPHTVGIDLGGVMLSRYWPGVSMMKRPSDPFLAWWLWRCRSRTGAKILMRDQGLRSLIKAMRDGRCAYLMPDEDLDSKHSVFVPFFSTQAATLPVVGRLAAVTGAKVLPVITRLQDSGHYQVCIGDPLTDFPTREDRLDAGRINGVFEASLRGALHQYLWTLKWFDTQPQGRSSPYD